MQTHTRGKQLADNKSYNLQKQKKNFFFGKSLHVLPNNLSKAIIFFIKKKQTTSKSQLNTDTHPQNLTFYVYHFNQI